MFRGHVFDIIVIIPSLLCTVLRVIADNRIRASARASERAIAPLRQQTTKRGKFACLRSLRAA